ncbi:AAA family ATPase [Kolteria novifilia]
MIKYLKFKNFKSLRDATLPLEPFTLIVGPNASGKSTALAGLKALKSPESRAFINETCLSFGSEEKELSIEFQVEGETEPRTLDWPVKPTARDFTASELGTRQELWKNIHLAVQVYHFLPDSLSTSSPLDPLLKLGPTGQHFSTVLDQLRDDGPESFEALNQEVARLFPEFDRILFRTPTKGNREFQLRMKNGGHVVPARDLSEGTLLALALVTLSYLPNPPEIIGLEEPDRGIHPRLLGYVRDSLYRLAYPDALGLDRKPVQVIAT